MVHLCKIQGSEDLQGKFAYAEAANKGNKGHLVGRPIRAKYEGKIGISQNRHQT